ncbi:MAG: NAD-dependent epimerase/dehydratase family protein [Planctomycetota bacterium]|nr:NAD-dependent epimerase/dehydratase family protein [Planctomycetota bacterium]
MAPRLIVGCGYVGSQVARKWLQIGEPVFAITRSNDRAAQLSQLGIKPIVWDWLNGRLPILAETLQNLEQPINAFATILIAVSHASQPDIPYAETHTRGLDNLDRLLKSEGWHQMVGNETKWIYLSTTGVFGAATPGDWVTEESKVSPERPGSIAAWAGEQWIASHIPGNQRISLRPVGIYGPGRVPRWQSIRDQVPLQVDPESYLNLIHVEDLATSIVKVSSTSMKSSLYCISDGEPVRRRDYYEFIAKLGGWPPPVFEAVKPKEPGEASLRSDGNKRVRNHRLQTELGMEWDFPSYREGLTALLGERRDRIQDDS